MLTNFHTHSIYCDGVDKPEDYVLMALKRKMNAIGFSSHVPISINNNWSMKSEIVGDYFKEIFRLKNKYAGKIEIYAGFEMDYLIAENENLSKKYAAMADYTIGSVHYLCDQNNAQYYCIDGSEEDVNKTFKIIGKGDNQKCVHAYYDELLRIINESRPNIIGHMDIIKKQNKNGIYFNEYDAWYVNLVKKVLDEIALAGVIIEVNTGGIIRNYITETYPSAWILKECHKRRIPIILSSDAHRAKDIDGLFAETITTLREIGFTKQRILQTGEWVDVDL